MIEDIVNQLRDRAYSGVGVDRLCEAAANEIERLRNGAPDGCESVQPATEPMPVFVSGSGSVTPVPYSRTDEKRVNRPTDRADRIAALEELSALDQELELKHGIAGLAGVDAIIALEKIDQRLRAILKHGEPSEETARLAEEVRQMIPHELLEILE